VQGVRQIWILDVARGRHTRLTFVPEGVRAPVWSPDGRFLAFSGFGSNRIYVQDADANGNAEAVFQTELVSITSDWSSDGRYLLYTQVSKNYDVWALANPAGGGERKVFPLANTDFTEMHGQFSPDSRWVAYDSTDPARLRSMSVRSRPEAGAPAN